MVRPLLNPDWLFKDIVKIFIISFSVALLIALSGFLVFNKNYKTEETLTLPGGISIEVGPKIKSKYPIHKSIIATVFWVGEEASEDNDYITNSQSAWDSDWVGSFGGVDDPENRDGFYPAGFVPKENPFYVALPYSDYNPGGRKTNLEIIPWYQDGTQEGTSLIKNRWVKVGYRGKVCFAQWENVGPYESDDTDYVFGMSKPTNTFGQKAGIDVSPAVRDCLKLKSGRKVEWQFVDDAEVPDGPWKEIITTSPPRWN